MSTGTRPILEAERSSYARSGLQNYAHYALYFADIFAMAAVAQAFYFCLQEHIENGTSEYLRYGAAVLIAMLAYSVFGFSNRLYEWRTFKKQIKAPLPTFCGLVFAFGTLLLLGFAFKVTEDFSRLWMMLWLAGFSIYLIISRIVLTWRLSRPAQGDFFRRRALIVGAGQAGQKVLDHLVRFQDQNIEVIGFLDDRETRLAKTYRGAPLIGKIDLADQLVREEGIDLIIIALPWIATERIESLVERFRSWSIDVYLSPDKLGFLYADRPVLQIGGAYFLGMQARPISEWCAVVKRIKDLSLALPALLLLSPLLALVALAIKLETKGPVFFLQERFGFNNNTIKVFKFRSMYWGKGDPSGGQQALKDDARVTRVGRFIRRTSIDELPQLFNVIIGNMSIVGPRPHSTKMHSGGRLLHELDSYASRHRVKPGITGWAQCNGWRGETDTQEKLDKRIECDLFYIENWSVYFDLVIILKTMRMLAMSEDNAY